MSGHEPPYLCVGTEVSAKYRGAFCEAKVKKVVRSVKCRVVFKETSNSAVVNDDLIKGTIRVGALVEVRHPESGQYVDATITKTTDSSMYTVVFDDGDERTLRRTMLCLKGDRHFVESETLDQLPLTHPEHFGTPVMKKMEKRRTSNFEGDSSYSEDSDSGDDDASSSRRTYSGRLADCIGKLVCAGAVDRRKGSWCPALVVLPYASDVPLKTKGHLLVRSFKDNKFFAVLKKETKEFTRDIALKKSEDKNLKVAIEKALLYLDNHELPASWDHTQLLGTDTEELSDEETSDDEQSEEKDRFVAQLFKFMDDRGTPINKAPTIGMKDLNLYRLYKLVKKFGGFNKVTSQMRWRLVYSKMNLPATNTASTSIMSAYKKYLHAFEHFDRTLGSNMGTTSRPHRSRNMLPFRDRDKEANRSPRKRASSSKESTPVKEKIGNLKESLPCPPTKEDMSTRSPLVKASASDQKTSKYKDDDLREPPKRVVKLPPMVKATTRSDRKLGKDITPQKNILDIEQKPETKKDTKKTPEEPKFIKKEAKKNEEKQGKEAVVKIEVKKEVEEKVHSHKARKERRAEELAAAAAAVAEAKQSSLAKETPPARMAAEKKTEKKVVPEKKAEETKVEIKSELIDAIGNIARRGTKRGIEVSKDEESDNDLTAEEYNSDNSCQSSASAKGKARKSVEVYPVGCRLGIRYGRGRNQKIYEAKVVDANENGGSMQYRVHYNGWNVRYDEWVRRDRIVYRVPDDKVSPIIKNPSSPHQPTSPKKSMVMLSKSAVTPKPSHPLLCTERLAGAVSAIATAHDAPARQRRDSESRRSDDSRKSSDLKYDDGKRPDVTKKTESCEHSEEDRMIDQIKKAEEVGISCAEIPADEVVTEPVSWPESTPSVGPSAARPRPTRSNSMEIRFPDGLPPKLVKRRSRRLSGHTDTSDINSHVSESESDEPTENESENNDQDDITMALEHKPQTPVNDEVKIDHSDEKGDSDVSPQDVELTLECSEVLLKEAELMYDSPVTMLKEIDVPVGSDSPPAPDVLEETESDNNETISADKAKPSSSQWGEVTEGEEPVTVLVPSPSADVQIASCVTSSECSENNIPVLDRLEEKSKSVMSNLDAILEAAGRYPSDEEQEPLVFEATATCSDDRKRKRNRNDKAKKRGEEMSSRKRRKRKEDIGIVAETPPTSPDCSSAGHLSPGEEQSTKSEHEANIEVAHYMSTQAAAGTSGLAAAAAGGDASAKDSQGGVKRKAIDAEKSMPKKLRRSHKKGESKKHSQGSDSDDVGSDVPITTLRHSATTSNSSVTSNSTISICPTATAAGASSLMKKSQHHHHLPHHQQHQLQHHHTNKRSPNVSKYNFYLDDSADELERDQKIAILQSRISEIKKIYFELKSEVALIDRRRKRARRKEREAAAALLQQTSQMMASQVASMS